MANLIRTRVGPACPGARVVMGLAITLRLDRGKNFGAQHLQQI
jgi:hypothetical protein